MGGSRPRQPTLIYLGGHPRILGVSVVGGFLTLKQGLPNGTQAAYTNLLGGVFLGSWGGVYASGINPGRLGHTPARFFFLQFSSVFFEFVAFIFKTRFDPPEYDEPVKTIAFFLFLL